MLSQWETVVFSWSPLFTASGRCVLTVARKSTLLSTISWITHFGLWTQTLWCMFIFNPWWLVLVVPVAVSVFIHWPCIYYLKAVLIGWRPADRLHRRLIQNEQVSSVADFLWVFYFISNKNMKTYCFGGCCRLVRPEVDASINTCWELRWDFKLELFQSN